MRRWLAGAWSLVSHGAGRGGVLWREVVGRGVVRGMEEGIWGREWRRDMGGGAGERRQSVAVPNAMAVAIISSHPRWRGARHGGKSRRGARV